MLLLCNCYIYYSPLLSFVHLTVSSWLTITCLSICNWKSQTSTWSFSTFGGGSHFDLPPIPHPTVNQVVFSDICHFVRLIPAHVVPWCFELFFTSRYSLSSLSSITTFLTCSRALVFFFFVASTFRQKPRASHPFKQQWQRQNPFHKH